MPLSLSVSPFNPETGISIQKRHSHTGNLNSEMPEDSKTSFLHCGHGLGVQGHVANQSPELKAGFYSNLPFVSGCLPRRHLSVDLC